MRLSRKEDKEKREEKLKRTVSSGSRLISAFLMRHKCLTYYKLTACPNIDEQNGQ